MSVLHSSAGCSVGLTVESTGTGDPPPGLMGNEGSLDPFSPARGPQPPLNYTAGVSVFAWSITSQPLHLLSCTHRLQDNQCPKLPGLNEGMDGEVFRLVSQAEGEVGGMGTAINLSLA